MPSSPSPSQERERRVPPNNPRLRFLAAGASLRGRTAAFAGARRGTASVEFAFVGVALIVLVVGILHIGYCLYCQVALDYAATAVAQTFETGGNQHTLDPNSNAFKTQTVCPALQGLLNCNSVTVLNYPVSDYYNQTSYTQFSPGSAGTTMVLTLIYTVPIPTWPVLTYGGGSSMVIKSTIPYINEALPTTSSSGS